MNQSRIESASDFMRNLIDLLKQQIPAFSNRTITQAVITPRVQYNEIDCGALTVANVIDSVNGVPLLNDYRMNPDEIKTIKEHHRSKLQQMGEDFEFEEGHQKKVKKVKLPVGGTHSDRETSTEPENPASSGPPVAEVHSPLSDLIEMHKSSLIAAGIHKQTITKVQNGQSGHGPRSKSYKRVFDEISKIVSV